jgi:hypothetical protein
MLTRSLTGHSRPVSAGTSIARPPRGRSSVQPLARAEIIPTGAQDGDDPGKQKEVRVPTL